MTLHMARWIAAGVFVLIAVAALIAGWLVQR